MKQNKVDFRTLGDIVLLAALVFAVVTLAFLNAHTYNGANKGLYIGNSEDCTVGFEYVGSVGLFGNVTGCNFGVILVHAMPIGDTVHAVLVVRGDCTADNATDDMYTGVTDGEMDTLNTPRVICYIPPADGAIAKNARKNATAAVVVSNNVPVVVIVEPVAPVVEYGNDTPVIVDVPETPEVETTGNPGNPGNLKGVGHAGENPNSKDTMPLDNAGGNGNGEHGNQGQNPNQSSAVALLVTVLIAGKKRISFDGIKSVNAYGRKVTLFTYDDKQTIYVVNNAKVERSFLSEPPFIANNGECEKYRL